MAYRVEDLAARGGVSVDTVRFYQGRGLLPAPARSGRVAWYHDDHLQRLLRVRELQAAGLTLAVIRRVLDEADASTRALAQALAEPPGPQPLDLPALAERTGAPVSVLEALEREGLLVARGDGDRPYDAADAEAVRAGLALLDAGVPLSELLALARAHDAAMREVADRAVDLFVRYVRDPVRSTAATEDEASARMVDALHRMLPAADAVVGHHFRRRVVAAARERMAGADGADADVADDADDPGAVA